MFQNRSSQIFRRVAASLCAAALVAVLAASCTSGQKPPSFDVLEKTIPELADAMKGGMVTSQQLVEQYLARIEAYDRRGPQINSLIMVNPNAVSEAEALDRERAAKGPRGPLHGIPIILKDNYDTRDMPTTAGSAALAGSIPPDDAFQVRKLRDAGAVILGKSNMHELARGITTISSIGGQTRNPYDITRNPGGSSGGTGSAIAANLSAFGMGSDTCGSIRIPAAHHSLVGLRPTQGLSSRDGIVPLSHTQDVGGPLTRTVEDLAIVLDVTVGPDPADPSTAGAASHVPKTYTAFLDRAGLQGARLGVLIPLVGNSPEDQAVMRVIRAAALEMQRQGAIVVEVEMPDLSQLLEGASLIDREFKFDLNEYLSHTPAAPTKTLGEILDRGLYHAALEQGFRSSNAFESMDTEEYRSTFAKRQQIRDVTIKAMDEHQVVALIYPTLRRTAAIIGDPQRGSNCTLSATSGLPAITVPAGFADDGMPVGVELLSRPFTEPQLLKLAYAFEQATHHRRPPASTPSLLRPPAIVMVNMEARGSEVVPAVATEALARASLSYDELSRRLAYDVSLAGLTLDEVLFAHLHRGATGVIGPIVQILTTQPTRRLSGTLTLSVRDAQDFRSGRLYLDIHTKQHLAGELRGQIEALGTKK